MIGQGSPSASRAPIAPSLRRFAGLFRAALLLGCFLPSCFATNALAAETTLGLRIAWGGGAERVWQGSVRLTQGSLGELQPLGIEADEPGSIWLDPDGIRIRQRSLRAYDGIDIVATADLDSRLLVTLADETPESQKTIEIPLRTLIDQPHNTTLDASGNRLLVSRSPGDRLRVKCLRDHLVFSPGESLRLEITAHLLEGNSTGIRYAAQMTSNPAGVKVWSQEYESGEEGTATTVELKVPDAEGVYDFSISALPPRWRPRLRIGQSLAERKLQLVVVDKRAAAEPPAAAMAKVLEINPMNPRWWERIGTLPMIPGMRKGPLGSGETATWDHPRLGTLIQLGQGGTGDNVGWEAYPLPLSNPGQPHVLEVEYPSDVPQAFGISILEPNAAGAVMPIGLDSGVYVSDEEAENTPQLLKHRLVFWPRTKSPIVLFTNRRQGSRAVYGKITVNGPPHSSIPIIPFGRADAGGTLPSAFPGDNKPQRLWAGYMDRPLFPENFSAPEALDPASHRSLDDWNTFLQGGTRLVRYLKHVGYNGLMLSAYADGSTIYPSTILEPTPRYDTGTFFASGQDPLRKDALEMLYRLFDREGLLLVTALHFSTPLPELEALLRAGGPEAVGVEWIGRDGAPWLNQFAPRQGVAPYYNPLNPRVQEAMLNVAREVVTRYSGHASFAGLALALSPEGFAALLGDDWGLDDVTIAAFERDTQTKVPGEGPTRFATRAKYLTTTARSGWLQWRAGVMADFQRRLEHEISQAREGAKLYLAAGAVLEGRQAQTRLRPVLPRKARLDDALLELGLSVSALRQRDGIVLLRPQHLRPTSEPLVQRATDLEFNAAPEIDRLFAGGSHTGSVFYHEPQKARLASFDAKSPFGPANTYTWLVSQMSPSAQRNRRRFIHSLATLDSQVMFDGGWLLPLGQEDSLKDVMSVYRMLPDRPFETLAGEYQPITIRTLSHEGQTYVYLVNDSPWDVATVVEMELPPDCPLEKLGTGRGVGALQKTANGPTWKAVLKPYDLVGVRFSAARARIRHAEVVISEQVRQSLERRIADLGVRVRALGNPQPLSVLENPGFEVAGGAEQVAGWNLSAAKGGNAQLDREQKHDGAASLRLSGSGGIVTAMSAPFDPPATGRLAIELWLRASDGNNPPTLRIAIEGQSREGKFEPYGLIQAVGATAAEPGGWVRYSFPIDDVPTQGLSSLSLRLDLLSPGQVWVDDVQIFDLAFSEAERIELSKLISSARVKWEAQQLGDCSRLLEGYWPQFLVANVPLVQAPLAERPRAAAVEQAPPRKPTVRETLNRYLPRPLQR